MGNFHSSPLGAGGLTTSPLGAEGLAGHAMILAAGLGSRLKPWTDNHPKALAIINGKSLLQHNIEYLQQFSICNVIVNVHHFADEIIETIKANEGWGSNLTISDEREQVLETGGGLQKAAWFFAAEKNFVLMNVDVLTDMPLQQMISFHVQQNALATLATTNRETSRYFLFDANNTLCGWRNVKTGKEIINAQSLSKQEGSLTQKAFSGIHVISTKIFSLIKQQGKFSMVDVYLDLAKEHAIYSFDHSAFKFIDVGKPESIAQAEVLFS